MADTYSNRLAVSRNLLTRIFSKVKVSGENFYKGVPCWEWQNALTKFGHGRIRVGYAHRLAHRFVYELFVGIVPSHLECDHLCRNPKCVNPVHIEPVTHQENMLRGNSVSGVNARKTHCPYGHEFIGNNLLPKKSGQRACRTCFNSQRLALFQSLPHDHPKKIKHRDQDRKYKQVKRAKARIG